MKILQVVAEHYGLIKTGGLADMVASLSSTIAELGEDIRVCLPAYAGTLEKLDEVEKQGQITVHGHQFEVLQGRLPGMAQPIVLLSCSELFERGGDPYRDQNGVEFRDNGWRFGCFNQAVTQLVINGIDGWRPDVVHAHDWHTALIPALLRSQRSTVKTVFTIHNFSFHGIFDRGLFDALDLPSHWWHPEEIEFYGRFSFMKAALNHAQVVTAVSPRYAREIATPEFGCGLEGLVQKQQHKLRGIVNGIDVAEWDPSQDKWLTKNYTSRTVVSGKKSNKRALQNRLGLPPEDVPLLIFIGRLADQKGADLILSARQQLSDLPLQLAVLGLGDPAQEQAFSAWAAERPQQVAAVIDIDEEMAHQLTAAADLQLMPSRFEPCGLSQMYAQRYGTLPVARATGGLADTVVDATPSALAARTATGFLFDAASADALMQGVVRALDLLQNKTTTNRLRRAAMAQDFSWTLSAQAYLDLYGELFQGTRDSGKAEQPAACEA